MTPLTAHNVLALTVQAAVLVLAGAPLPRLLGIQSPRARLGYWRALLLACLLLPALQPLVPLPEPAAAPTGPGLQVNVAPDPTAVSVNVLAPAGWLLRVDILDVVAFGIAARLAWVTVGLLALGRLRRESHVLAPRPASVREAAILAGADAEFRVAPRAAGPVTFGVARPVVVVPPDFDDFRPEQQRAVACHELIHVRRGDWLRHLGEEVIRSIAWFHPAAWWLTRQIRLAREQLVDQEVVRQTRDRKPYLDALLRLASPDRRSRLVPAPLFLGRSHLSERVALLLKEVRMSRPRLALSFLVMAAVLVVTGRAIVAAYPLHGAPDGGAMLQAPGEQPPRATPGAAARRDKPFKLHDVRPAFAAGAPDVPVVVSFTVDPSGAVVEASGVEGPPDLVEIASAAVRQWRYSPAAVTRTMLAGFNPAAAGAPLADQPPVFVGGGVRAPVKIKDVKPTYPSEAQKAGVQGVVILETQLASDGTVAQAEILRSIPMLDRAALTAVLGWKFTAPGLPLRMTVTVNFTLDDGPARGVPGGVGGGVKGGVPGGIVGGVPGGVVGGVAGAPLRVGGNIKAPRRIVDVKPVYPQEALDAKLQGVVIIEATIGPDGKVQDAKVLRSIPLLDQAALEAVRQWEFEPTLMNGVAVPVIMTVTVNFTLE